ncbi:MAG: biotin--[acetyl-CoA-carboxylase] ligase [Alphaproteobacteria bacterium]|nr:biotin--[acetyl-CoA-carboxylase] ligase [Alphaproteobacteria bacterium]
MSWVIHEFNELESTNQTAFELAELGKISDREIILAKQQSKGRGRQNRHWESPEGNLYFSLLLRPKISAKKLPQLSFVGIATLCLAVEKLVTNLVKVKWPNDLLVEEKKVAGLLLESKISEKNCEFVVLGIGMNLISNPVSTIFPASNLKNFSIEISPEEMLQKFLYEFEKLYQNWLDFGFAGTRNIWLTHAYRLGQEIKVNGIEGIFYDLDEEGNLLLKSGNNLQKIFAGDLLLL